MVTLTGNIHNKQIHWQKTNWWLSGARLRGDGGCLLKQHVFLGGWWKSALERCLFLRGVSFRGDENVLELAVWLNNFMNILKTNEFYVRWINCMVHKLYLNKAVIKIVKKDYKAMCPWVHQPTSPKPHQNKVHRSIDSVWPIEAAAKPAGNTAVFKPFKHSWQGQIFILLKRQISGMTKVARTKYNESRWSYQKLSFLRVTKIRLAFLCSS